MMSEFLDYCLQMDRKTRFENEQLVQMYFIETIIDYLAVGVKSPLVSISTTLALDRGEGVQRVVIFLRTRLLHL